jgi:hypothetical protein
MKLNNKFLKNLVIVLGLIGLLQACKLAGDTYLYKAQQFVVFAGDVDELTVSEASGGVAQSLELTVLRSSGDISAPLTINYSIDAKFVANGANATGTFDIVGSELGKIIIPAGKSQAKIKIQTVNNNNTSDGAKQLTLTINSASDNNLSLGYPGPDGLKKSIKVLIQDDDCALNLDEFVGTYQVTYTSQAFGFENVYDCTVQRGAGNTLIVSNPPLYDPNSVFANLVDVAPSTEIAIDPATLTATVPDDQYIYTSAAQRFVGTFDLDPGSVSTCTKSFTVSFYLYRADGSLVDIVEGCTFTKK